MAGLVHRDLKYLNILISIQSNDLPKIKITDFGQTVKLNSNEYIAKLGGTVGFIAPEVLQNQPSDSKSDIWSLGVILYSLVSSRVPFCGNNKAETIEATVNKPLVFKKRVWTTISEECKDLLSGMLDKDQNTRLDI